MRFFNLCCSESVTIEIYKVISYCKIIEIFVVEHRNESLGVGGLKTPLGSAILITQSQIL